MWIVWKLVRSRPLREVALTLLVLLQEHLTGPRRSQRQRPRPWDDEPEEHNWR